LDFQQSAFPSFGIFGILIRTGDYLLFYVPSGSEKQLFGVFGYWNHQYLNREPLLKNGTYS